MYAVHYINFFGRSDKNDRLDFANLADAQHAYNGIARNFQDGKYGPEIVEIALYDESTEEMLQSTAQPA